MMIGGSDHHLIAPASANLTDVILRVCRAHWPQPVVQGGEEEGFRPLAPLTSEELARRLPPLPVPQLRE